MEQIAFHINGHKDAWVVVAKNSIDLNKYTPNEATFNIWIVRETGITELYASPEDLTYDDRLLICKQLAVLCAFYDSRVEDPYKYELTHDQIREYAKKNHMVDRLIGAVLMGKLDPTLPFISN